MSGLIKYIITRKICHFITALHFVNAKKSPLPSKKSKVDEVTCTNWLELSFARAKRDPHLRAKTARLSSSNCYIQNSTLVRL